MEMYKSGGAWRDVSLTQWLALKTEKAGGGWRVAGQKTFSRKCFLFSRGNLGKAGDGFAVLGSDTREDGAVNDIPAPYIVCVNRHKLCAFLSFE